MIAPFLLLFVLHLLRLGNAFAPSVVVVPSPSAQSEYRHQTISARPRTRSSSSTIRRSAATTTKASSSSSSEQSSLMGGTSTFETWFKSKSAGGKASDNLRHATFQNGALRGLEFKDGKDNIRGVIDLPEKLVLRTEYSRNKEGRVEEDWDAKLAVMLAKECLKGKESDLYGYCSLLTRDTPVTSDSDGPPPPPTAPDALRHWTSPQLSRLKKTPTGEKLVKTSKKQTKRWIAKYAALPAEDRSVLTEDQFLWAMETVHSRAFRGNFGGGLLNQFQKLTIPFVAAAFGLIVILANDNETADLIAQICGLLVLGPAFLSMMEEGNMGPGSGKADAVLLPFIDSANHDEKAESNIEYDPVNGMFNLDLGRKCLKEEEDGRTQLYISYGLRSDRELLLNYGFLPGIDGGGGGEQLDDEAARDKRRARLAEAFLRRNP